MIYLTMLYEPAISVSMRYVPNNQKIWVRLLVGTEMILILCLWFCASLIYINNCPTRCKTKQFFFDVLLTVHSVYLSQ